MGKGVSLGLETQQVDGVTARGRYTASERQRLDRLYRELINPQTRVTRSIVPKNSQGQTGAPPEYAIDHPIENSSYRESVIGLILMVDNWAGLDLKEQRRRYLEYPVSLPFTLEQINEFCYLRNEGRPGMRSAWRNGASADWGPGEDELAGGIVGAATYYLLLDRWIVRTQLEEWLRDCPNRIGVMRIREAMGRDRGKDGLRRLRRQSILDKRGEFEHKVPQLNQIVSALVWLGAKVEGLAIEHEETEEDYLERLRLTNLRFALEGVLSARGTQKS